MAAVLFGVGRPFGLFDRRDVGVPRNRISPTSEELGDQLLADVDDAARNTDYVQSLDRGLAVIRVFDAAHPEQTLSEVARATGLTRAAARRFLLTLVRLGYMRTDGRLFALRPRVLELGYAYLSSLSLPDLARPHMEDLVAKVHDSCSLSVLDDTDVVYVARIPTKRIMTIAISVGTRFPAYATSMGRVLLAAQPDEWLDEYLATASMEQLTARTIATPSELRTELAGIRKNQFAIVDQELEQGIRSIAVPLHDIDGHVVAALNVSLHVSRGTLASMKQQLLPALIDTARAIESDLRSRNGS